MTSWWYACCLIVLLAASAVALGAFWAGISAIVRQVRGGETTFPSRARPVGRRTWAVIKRVLGHTSFRKRPGVRAAHWLVMLSFPLLFFTLVASYGYVISPDFRLPFAGAAWWNLTNEVAAWGGFLGIVTLIFVRAGSRGAGPDPGERQGRADARPARFVGSNRAWAYFVEAVIVIVCWAVIMLQALEPDVAHLWVTARLGDLLAGLSAGAREALTLGLSLVKVLVSLVWMAVVGVTPRMGIAWHRFLGLVTLYTAANPGGKSLGALEPLHVGGGDGRVFDMGLLEDPTSLGDAPVLGAGTKAELTWKNRLDVLTCSECGRCQEVCPAWATGKVLSPKAMVTAIRDADEDTPLVGGVISAQALWDCTNCGACVAACPLDIELLSLVSAMRRHQVLSAGKLPREASQAIRKISASGNAWGSPASKRTEWTQGLDFKVPVIGTDIPDATSVDYLLWVGSMGAFDPDSARTTAAVAELLHRAGVSFAILGDAETSSGEYARRVGDEALYLADASAAIELLRGVKAERILVTSPHVFNVFANEFRQLGAEFRVEHHTQVFNRLLREGRLRTAPPPVKPGQPRPLITYHDPCFLGRHNGEYDAPREILGQIGQVVEMPRNREQAMCCGAGGGHAFMEDAGGVRISAARAQEAAETGARFVATACPGCHIMLESSMPERPDGSKPIVRDVAQLLLEAVRRADKH